MSALMLALSLAAQAAVPADVLESVRAGRSLDAAALQGAAVSDDWARALGAQVALAERRVPGLAAEVRGLAPVRTRAGTPRFVDPVLRDADAAPFLLERLVDGDEDAGQRVALIDAARRSGGDWQAAVAGLAQVETEPAVRRMLVEVLDKVDLALARPALEAGLQDPHPEVRAAALRAIGAHERGAELGALLVAAVGDSAATVRAEACRSLGWLEVAEAWTALEAAVSDDDAQVRLRALRALQRIDSARAALLPAVARAASDSDAKVARAAQQLLGG